MRRDTVTLLDVDLVNVLIVAPLSARNERQLPAHAGGTIHAPAQSDQQLDLDVLRAHGLCQLHRGVDALAVADQHEMRVWVVMMNARDLFPECLYVPAHP